MGSSGSQTTTQNSQPMPLTSDMQKVQDAFNSYLYGSPTTPSYVDRTKQDTAFKEGSARSAYGTSSDLVNKYLAANQANIGGYADSLNTAKKGIDASNITNQAIINSLMSVATPRQGATLSFGDFKTGFVPGSQRYATGAVSDANNQIVNNVLKAAGLDENIYNQRQNYEQNALTTQQALSELLDQINQQYTPNAADNVIQEYFNQLFQENENRRYANPTVTTTETAKSSPGLLGILGTLGGLATGTGNLVTAIKQR